MSDGFGIPGRWMASFKIGGADITNLYGFESFKLVEQAGNQLPEFTLQFRTQDTGLVSFLNEGNVITAGIGVTQLDMTGIPLVILSKRVSRADSANLRIVVNGFYNALSYTNNNKVNISQPMSGIERMNQIVGQYFTPDFSTSASNDSMSWIQHGIPDKEHVQDVWTHCDLGSGNFPMIGITSDGTFRLRTMSDLTGSTPVFNYTNTQPVGGGNVPFHYDYEIHSDTGFANYSSAYSRSTDIINLDQGPGNLFNSLVGSFLGQSANLEQAAGIAIKMAGSLLSNENNHPTYHQSHADNVANLTNMSSTKLYVDNSDIFFPIKTLDKILFTDTIEGPGGSIQAFSGQYIATEITRHIEASDSKFHTMVTAVRESMNNVMTGVGS